MSKKKNLTKKELAFIAAEFAEKIEKEANGEELLLMTLIVSLLFNRQVRLVINA